MLPLSCLCVVFVLEFTLSRHDAGLIEKSLCGENVVVNAHSVLAIQDTPFLYCHAHSL